MHSQLPKPKIAITMGDPAGIGPELCLGLLAEPTVSKSCTRIIIGSLSVLRKVAQRLDVNLAGIDVIDPRDPTDNLCEAGIIDIDIDASLVSPGVVSAHCGQAAYRYIEAAIDLALRNKVQAVTTGPINKAALNLAGIRFPGHTEIFAQKTGTREFGMMLTSEQLTVSFVTTHTSYRNVPSMLTSQRVTQIIRLTSEALAKIKDKPVKLAVCGLNPHAGESGLFGDEEERLITPGISQARRDGLDVEGPFSPDALFTEDFRAKYDAIVCQYHDQGHIPFKMLAFSNGVNVTLGLPIIRTSVDHGTAFDIAWQGKAGSQSLKKAIELAAKLAAGDLS